jgi:hypothetical protein
MQTLASILAGTGGNPYDVSSGSSIAPQLQQAMLAQQIAGQGQTAGVSQQPVLGQTQQPQTAQQSGLTGLGSLLPGVVSGTY